MNLYLSSIILGVFASLIASVVFWLLSYYYTGTNIVFSPKIEKSSGMGNRAGKYRYRIRFRNIGHRDFFEVSMMVKLTSGNDYTFLGIGNNDNILPNIAGQKSAKKGMKSIHTLTIFPNATTMREFTKKKYPEEIIRKSDKGELCLEDIINLNNEFIIEIYVFGNDALTGVRKHYHKSYTYNDIIEGKFITYKYQHQKTDIMDIIPIKKWDYCIDNG